jgi:hypothetical protein
MPLSAAHTSRWMMGSFFASKAKISVSFCASREEKVAKRALFSRSSVHHTNEESSSRHELRMGKEFSVFGSVLIQKTRTSLLSLQEWSGEQPFQVLFHVN